MNIFKSTKGHSKYWRERKADWDKNYTQTYSHPHRYLILQVLASIKWLSLIEVGCNSAPNLINIVKQFPGCQIGGVDVNPEAIALAEKTFHGGLFKVNSGDDIMLSDKACDVILYDACLIYVSPLKIKKYLEEAKRIGRSYIVMCEFNSKSWWDRFKVKFKSGYNVYDYKKLLTKYGFYDYYAYKLKPEDWPGGGYWEKYGSIIVARIPK